jgi:hypothetical protein
MSAEKSGCLLGWLASLVNKSDGKADAENAGPLPYAKREHFFSKAERSFYGVLKDAVGTDYVLFAKVRLCDLVKVAAGTERWQSHHNRIASKHVDFVLCDTQYVRPMLVIELDDGSHDREDRKDRDGLVDRILTAAQIPILRVAAKASYPPKELREKIQELLKR